MTQTIALPTNVSAVGSTPHTISRFRSFAMEFDVIITYRVAQHTLVALEAVSDQFVQASGWQIAFTYGMPFRAKTPHYRLMLRLKQNLLDVSKAVTGLGEADVTMISTSADWTLWEQITGLSHRAEAAKSNVAENGKFYFPAFDQQVEVSKRSGKSLSDLSDEMMLSFYERK